MGSTQTLYEVCVPPAGSDLTPSHIIAVSGPVPDWVLRCARPYSGTLPKDRPIFPVDTEAEAREREQFAAAKPKPVVYLSQADIRTRTGLTDAQIEQAMAPEQGRASRAPHLGMPRGGFAWDSPERRHRTWPSNGENYPIDQWLALWRSCTGR